MRSSAKADTMTLEQLMTGLNAAEASGNRRAAERLINALYWHLDATARVKSPNGVTP